MKKIKLNTLILSSFLLGISATCSACKPFLPFLEEEESFKAYKRSYSMNQIQIAESNTFRKLNDVTYPFAEYPVQSEISDEEKLQYGYFCNSTYGALMWQNSAKNISYSPLGLYSLINQMEYASSDDYLTSRLNTLLGLTEDERVSFYRKIMKANSFANEENTTQLKNAAFFNATYNPNQNFVNNLTNIYCEAYQLNFTTEANKIVEWVNKAVNSDGFIDTRFLEIDKDTELFLFSTLYFKNAWSHKYLEEDNFEDDFYLDSSSKVNANFMKHSYHVDSYYDYDKYIAVKDYYYGGYASVTYLVPKSTTDNIYDLTRNVNIFRDNEYNKISDRYSDITVNLTVPKFKTKTELDFKRMMKNLNLDFIFDPSVDSFHNAFDDEKLDGYNIYVQNMKQKNEVEFNESGSVIKSVSMASMAKETAMAPSMDTIDVNLNQPFIYIIKDTNGVPIFIGHVDNPLLKD